MATVLRAAGLHVKVHDDHFRRDALDPEWFTAVGEKNWIVVTRDERIRYRVAEKQAMRRAFVLAAQGDLRADMLAHNFLKALAKVRRVVEKQSPPLSQRCHAAVMLRSSGSDQVTSGRGSNLEGGVIINLYHKRLMMHQNQQL